MNAIRTIKNILALSLLTASLAVTTASVLPLPVSAQDTQPVSRKSLDSQPLDSEQVIADASGQIQVNDKKGTLKLTGEQKDKLISLKSKLKDSVQPKFVEIAKHKRAVKDLLTKETIDKQAILKEQSVINDLTAQIASEKLAFQIDASENLSPEQRQAVRRKSLSPKGKHGHAMKGKRHGGLGKAMINKDA